MRYPYNVDNQNPMDAKGHKPLVSYVLLGAGVVLFTLVSVWFVYRQFKIKYKADQVTVAYLKRHLAQQPTDRRSRYRLARIYKDLGQLDKAREALALLPVDKLQSRLDWQIYWLDYLLKYYQYTDNPRRLAYDDLLLKNRLKAMQGRLLFAPLDSKKLKELAQQASYLNQPQLALILHYRARKGVKPSAKLYEQASDYAFQAEQYSLCARFRFKAQNLAKLGDIKRYYFEKALTCYLASDQTHKALAEGEKHIETLKNDPKSLLLMADIAHQANGSVKALHYLQKALEHGPRLSQYADIGYEIYLANNELTKANQLAKKVFNQWPQSYKWRQRVAESSLWAGNAQYSLPHWVKLWRDRGDKQAYRHAVAIARQTNSYHTLITIYSRKLEDEPQKAQLWLKLANVYAALGRPATAIDKLKNGYQQTGRSDLIERIAYFYQATDCPDKSLDWYKRYVREHGLAVGIAYQIARLNSMLGDDQAAFYWLAKVQNEAAKANHDFWHLYAYLSWQLRHFNHALSSYEQLAETNALTRQEALRLLYLMEQQDPEKAYKRAYQA